MYRDQFGVVSSALFDLLILRFTAAAPSTLKPIKPEMSVIGSGTSLGLTGMQLHGGGFGISLGITTGGGTGGTTITGGGDTGMIGEGGETVTTSEPVGTGGKKANAPDDSTVKAAHPNAAAGTILNNLVIITTSIPSWAGGKSFPYPEYRRTKQSG